LGQRLYTLPLGKLALACLARNRAEDHALMEEIFATEGREGFAAAWFRANGLTKETSDVETLQHQPAPLPATLDV
jgi:hypothetical protein